MGHQACGCFSTRRKVRTLALQFSSDSPNTYSRDAVLCYSGL